MLATFIIGLREGLEAALIVSIIATFLRRNGRSLRGMWIGVIVAIVLSIAVGVTLRLIEKALPQAAQEGMETVIGIIAVGFVTGMVLWMSKHARSMKRDLEASAQAALSSGTSAALAVMAFLAVLREGFESAVFLLATFSAAGNGWAAAAGACLGFACAIVLGVALYHGGIRLNVGKLLHYSSLFLILVAAGLVVSAFRTAHEAGWLLAGQQRTVDLSWLAPNGSIRSALFTGVLGIPADPRVVEVISWFAYLIPMLAFCLWPAAKRPTGRAAARLKIVIAALLLLVAAGLAFAFPTPSLDRSAAPILDAAGTRVGDASLDGTTLVLHHDGAKPDRIALRPGGPDEHAGIQAEHWVADLPATFDVAPPSSMTREDVQALNGNRLPVGVNAQTAPGPYDARWTRNRTLDVWVTHGALLDASAHDSASLTLSGGGLASPRTVPVPSASAQARQLGVQSDWVVSPNRVEQTSAAAASFSSAQSEASFWGRFVPVLLALAALAFIASAVYGRRRTHAADPAPTGSVDTSHEGATAVTPTSAHPADGDSVPAEASIHSRSASARVSAREPQAEPAPTATAATTSDSAAVSAHEYAMTGATALGRD